MTDYLVPAPYAIVPSVPRRKTGREIIAEVAERHKLTPADLRGPCRRRAISWPRQEAMWELQQRTRLSTPQIGDLLGGRDHTTVLHGLKRHKERMGL